MNKEECMVVTNGNELAARFLLSFLAFVHRVDDCYDKDRPNPLSPPEVIREQLWWTEELLFNPWVQENKAMLWPLIVTGANSWVDSEEWAYCGDTRKRLAAEVLKSGYQELVFFVAWLCGGQEHMRKVSQTYREYNFERKD
jgi:hypothetical protein